MKVSEMNVELVDHMGSDLSVVNAARVSFAKESVFEYETEADWMASRNPKLNEKDAKLIAYLAKHGHWTPFAHAFLSFRIKAPIFVARQLVKHQVGLAWNEVSRRYVDSEPEYFKLTWRMSAENVKQGSAGEITDAYIIESADEIFWEAVEHCHNAYLKLLGLGIAPEQARAVTNLNSMTEWIWSGSLAAFARVCKLRLDPHAQKETQTVAEAIKGLAEPLFPVSFPVLIGEVNERPEVQVIKENLS